MSAPIFDFDPAAGSGVHVDLDRLVVSRLLVQANSGGGKSRALRYILEQTHGRVQHLVLDPEGEFASLRERFPYVLAGKGGDVPADPRSAGLLVRRLVELGASAIIDLYELKLPDRRRFVRTFLDELMHLPHALWHPVLVVLDEAHNFAPERGSGESESTDAVTALATQGRKRGYCLVAATQRISKLHKDVAAELLNKMIGRTGLDVDRKRAGAEIGFDNERSLQLRSLSPGEFYAYGPAIANDQVVLTRSGPVVTTHPEAGKIGSAPPPPPDKVRKILAQLADLPKEAEAEARSLEDSKKRIAQLERELRTAKKVQPAQDPAAAERAAASARASIEVSHRRAVQRWAKDGQDATRHLTRGIEILGAGTHRLSELFSSMAGEGAPTSNGHGPATAPPSRTAVLDRPATVARPVLAQPREAPASGEVSGPQQRMLDAIAAFEAIGMPAVLRSHVAVFSGQSPRSSGFDKNMSTLSAGGYIDRLPGGLVQLTSAGHELARAAEAPATLEALHDAWIAKLSGPQRLMLRLLLDAYPEAMERDDLARGSGQSPTSSGFDKNESTLSALGLLERMPGKVRRAGSILFPEAAMEWIGDTSVKAAQVYNKSRSARMEQVAEMLSADDHPDTGTADERK